MIDLEAIKKQLNSLNAFPWCERWCFEAIRHLVRNCDIECPEHGEACFKFGYDGTFIAQAPQTISELVAEVERERALFMAMSQKYHEAQLKLKDVEQENLKLLKTIDSLKLELEGR